MRKGNIVSINKFFKNGIELRNIRFHRCGERNISAEFSRYKGQNYQVIYTAKDSHVFNSGGIGSFNLKTVLRRAKILRRVVYTKSGFELFMNHCTQFEHENTTYYVCSDDMFFTHIVPHYYSRQHIEEYAQYGGYDLDKYSQY
jgi:hypothetical protein